MATSSTNSSATEAEDSTASDPNWQRRVKAAVAQLREDEFHYGEPPGLLDILFQSFGLDVDPKLVAGFKRPRKGKPALPSSLDDGKEVHRELDEYFKLNNPVHHRYAHWVLDLIEREGWIIIDTEVPLIDKVAGIMTRIDAVAYSPRDDRVLVLEYKTGYSQRYDARLYGPTLQMRHGKPVFHTARTRAYLQTAWNWTMFKQNTGITQVSGVVVRVNDTLRKAQQEYIWDWARVNGEFIVDTVRAHQLAKRTAHKSKLVIIFNAGQDVN